jgi:hypothetical protein
MGRSRLRESLRCNLPSTAVPGCRSG